MVDVLEVHVFFFFWVYSNGLCEYVCSSFWHIQLLLPPSVSFFCFVFPHVFFRFCYSHVPFAVVFIGSTLFALQQLSGINAIFYFSSTVFKNAGVPSDLANVFVGIANLSGTTSFLVNFFLVQGILLFLSPLLILVAFRICYCNGFDG
jgi:hypothetical protein